MDDHGGCKEATVPLRTSGKEGGDGIPVNPEGAAAAGEVPLEGAGASAREPRPLSATGHLVRSRESGEQLSQCSHRLGRQRNRGSWNLVMQSMELSPGSHRATELTKRTAGAKGEYPATSSGVDEVRGGRLFSYYEAHMERIGNGLDTAGVKLTSH